MSVTLQDPQAIIEHHSKSFALASKLLPARCRQPAVVLYAWCRRCDDALDDSSADDSARALKQLQLELEQVYSREPITDVVLAAFAQVARNYTIPQQYPSELLRGMAMDADGRTYATVADLLDYCYCVAGVVGLMMCHVLGVSSDDALPHAAHLGIAMQLTNICRDVREDFERGRSYLPEEMLPGDVQWAIARDVEAGRADTPPALRTVVRELLQMAESYYRSGDEGLQYLAPRCALSIRTARMVYSGIGRRIEAADCNVLAGRSFLTKGMKLRLAGAATARSLFDLTRCLRTGYGQPQSVLGANDVLRLR